MIVVKVWCLPSDQSEENLNRLHKTIVRAVKYISQLGVKDENDMACLLPPDLMQYGLGEEIIIEISGLPDVPKENRKVCRSLAVRVGRNVSVLYPEARINCSARIFDSSEEVWTSAKPKDQ